MKSTLISHYSPRTRARAQLRARVEKLVVPFFLSWCTLFSALSTIHFFTWLAP